MQHRSAVILLLTACATPRRETPPDAATPDATGATYGPCDTARTFAERTPLRTLHVEVDAPEGGDGSVAAPFATIEPAAAIAEPGTWIQLGPGIHEPDQNVPDLRGTEDAPIWIGGDPSRVRPVIAGGVEALHFTRSAYVAVSYVEIHGQTGNGITIDDGDRRTDDTAAHHVAITNVDIHDVGGTGNQDCVKASGVNDLFVYDSRFARCGGAGSGSGVDHVGCHRSVIARNVFVAMSGNAVQAKGGSTDIDIRQNRVLDGGERAFNLGGSTDLQSFRPPLSTSSPNAEARRIRAFNNVVTGTATAPFAFVGCFDCLVAHNLVLGNPRWLIEIVQETVSQSGYTFEPAANGRVINNSFVWLSTALSTFVHVGSNTAPTSFTFSHNLWHASDSPSQSTPSLPVVEDGAVIGMGTVYRIPTDPYSPLPHLWCESGPEIRGATALPEIDGTFDGWCRADALPTIGPLANTIGGCTL